MALRKILEIQYSDFYYDSVISSVEQHFKNNEKTMTDDDFKDSINHFKGLILKYKAKVIMFNFQNLHYVITPEIQTWVDNNMTKKVSQVLTKTAFLYPFCEKNSAQQFVEKISQEQCVREFQTTTNIELTNSFTDIVSARLWLKQI